EVGVMTVVPKTVPYVPTFVAQTESSRQVEIVARVAGFLDKIAYTEGELVKKGSSCSARPEAVPGAARGGPRRADVAAGALHHRRGESRAGQAARRRTPSRSPISTRRLQGDYDVAAAVFSTGRR
ncbi:MAG: efflux transporter periplasmic adaptor subunit, partial [Betaproteobacteria bacterium]|nr:efflux transporter periplasmic adaptor subunit [Candidatus Proximibacter danicus]